MRFMATDAYLEERFVKIGLMPDGGGTFWLPRLVGLGRAMDMCLLGQPVPADEALRIGLVHQVVAADMLGQRGEEFARELAAIPALAYIMIKQGLQRGLETGMESEWQANLSSQSLLLTSAGFKQQLAATKDAMAKAKRG